MKEEEDRWEVHTLLGKRIEIVDIEDRLKDESKLIEEDSHSCLPRRFYRDCISIEEEQVSSASSVPLMVKMVR